MIKKCGKWCFLLWKILYRTIAIGLVLGLLCLSFLFWRLSTHPLDITFLVPEIQKYVLPENSQIKIEADSVRLSARMTRAGLFHISVKNMALLGKNEELILDLPRVRLSYGLMPLLTLNYMPSSIQVDEPLLQLILTKDEQLLLTGTDSADLTASDTSVKETTTEKAITTTENRLQTSEGNLPQSAQTPASAQDTTIPDTTSSANQPVVSTENKQQSAQSVKPNKALIVHDIHKFADMVLKFRRITFNKASVIINDEKTGRTILIPQLNFALRRSRFTQYHVDVDTAVRMGRDLMAFKGNLLYNSLARTIEFDIFYDRVNLSRFERVVPLLDGLKILLRGEINGSLDIAEGRKHWRNAFKALTFTVGTVEPGSVQLPEPLETIYPVEKLVATGSFSENLNALEIQPIKVSLTTGLTADVDIKVAGIGSFLDENNFNLVKTTLNARMNNIPMKEVPSVWPASLGPDAHQWVKENLQTGTATTALFTLYFTGEEISDLIGDIDFKDTTVDYLHPMQPIQNAGGKVMLYPDKVEIFADRGQINNIRLLTGNVYLTDLQADLSHARIELDVDGPANEILALINEEPLTLLSGFEIDPSKVKGNIAGQATLEFPLTESLTAKDVIVDVKASVSNAEVQSADNAISLKEAAFGLLVNNEGLALQGTGKYNNIPLQIKWEEFFLPTDEKPTQSIYTVSGTVTDLFFKPYFADVSDYLIGNIAGNVIYQKSKNKTANILINADLKQAELMLYPVAYTKVSGVPASLNAELFLDETGTANMARFSLSADQKALDIEGLWQAEKTKTSLTLNKVQAPGTDFSAMLSFNDKKDIALSLKGKSWLMTELKNTPYFKKQMPTPIEEDIPTSVNLPAPPPAVDIDVSMDTLTLNPKAPLKKVSVKAKRSGFTWKNLFIFAQGNDAISLNLTSKTNKLDGLVNDTGDFLNRLNFSSEFAKGKTMLSATQSENGIINGTVTIQNLNFKNPGFITQALTILGIVDALRGKELTFSNGSIPFELSPVLHLKVNDGVLYGTSLGITFAGKASLNALKLSGSVIPAYAVNSLPGRIPIIGELFRNAPNGGLMGVQYDLSGTPTQPVVKFNPLSSITPGILSRLFQ